MGWVGLLKDGKSCEEKAGTDFPDKVYLDFVNLCC